MAGSSERPARSESLWVKRSRHSPGFIGSVEFRRKSGVVPPPGCGTLRARVRNTERSSAVPPGSPSFFNPSAGPKLTKEDRGMSTDATAPFTRLKMDWAIDFRGRRPALEWLEGLDEVQRKRMEQAIRYVELIGREHSTRDRLSSLHNVG